MNKDRSLEEIDILKLLFYALLFIVVCIVMVFAFLVPSIKDYKNAKINNNDKAVNLYKIEQVYNGEYLNLKNLKQKNEKPLDAISSRFNEIKFVAQTGRFFSNVKLFGLPKENKDEKFLRYELNVTGSIKSPQNFYNFLNFVNEYENIIKVDFPISMQSDGNRIDTSFKIKVYMGETDLQETDESKDKVL
ncbi:hypothetical protein [Campylobacter hyointestinalis]|uniref:Membrane protein n=1 Tax=Campylobacter hyointestinalis subsp. hyointestinalis TaxID=91352 RepID=A0A855NE64_CAMHY|nr:hypothetical protein [Campylobacter hyointestinalis]ANE32993.1 hypothetical protein CHH_1382 [Campylobacter hyointestinalis subsp. hyointestinalis LMG 9260]MBT0611798.1 hypothetical protein [Campylobacter hyointestinalis subsp. hyointestinalis]MDY2999340.1 hypothetical protein [Campylobacter hyointestinalis]PPB52743.1 hypothetical protein CDQ69_06810 [Campylobacter hyointestinalis subsp. hyointestinalis]PPB58703.1 hypothetical protein CDQ70_05190 [Campylobacter hyointestinalis subsp. hyoint